MGLQCLEIERFLDNTPLLLQTRTLTVTIYSVIDESFEDERGLCATAAQTNSTTTITTLAPTVTPTTLHTNIKMPKVYLNELDDSPSSCRHR